MHLLSFTISARNVKKCLKGSFQSWGGGGGGGDILPLHQSLGRGQMLKEWPGVLGSG